MPTGRGEPVGQKRHTNIAVVRMKKAGFRFEVACYKNTVMAYRSGAETDVDEVLQSKYVYTNISKGIFAPLDDIKAAFGTDDQEAVCLMILKSGEYQVSDKERASKQTSLFRDICTVLCSKTVNPDTNRPYPFAVVEQSLRDAHFNVDVTKAAKLQALQVALPLLQNKGVRIERAKMRVKIKGSTKSSERSQSAELVASLSALTLGDNASDGASAKPASTATSPVPAAGGAVIWEIDPSEFRRIDATCRENGWTIEVLELSVHEQGDEIGGGGPPPAQRSGMARMMERAHLPVPPPPSTVAALDAPVQIVSAPAPPPSVAAPPKPAGGGGGGLTSATAPGVTFQSRDELKAHLKSDWHRVNLKRKSAGLRLLSKEEAEGEALLEEMEREKGLSEFM